MEVVSEMQAKFKKENKTQKVEAEGKGPSVEKFETQIEKLDQRIATAKTQSEDRENNKEVALGTSKIVSCSHFLLLRSGVLTCMAELHRSALDCRVHEEVQCPH
jgi:DNA topoisomerase-1